MKKLYTILYIKSSMLPRPLGCIITGLISTEAH